MKAIFALVTLIGFFCIVQGSLVTDEQKAKIDEYRRLCVISSGVTLEDLASVQNDDWSSKNPNIRVFIYCMMTSYGFMNEGVFNVEVFSSKIPDGVDKTNIIEAVNECLKDVDKNVPREEYAFNLGACYNSKKTGYELF